MLLAAPVPAQDGREPVPEEDPYTRGKAEALEKAGYVSFGPFVWGDGHSSSQLAESLGGVPVLFVETAHFRLASSLDTYPIGEDKLERELIERELKRLAKRLPRVKPKTRELDPWLRLHLFAQRLEELYADFGELLEVPEDLFAGRPFARRGGEPLPFELIGRGPYLGLNEKFSVLLTQKTSTLARYSAAHLDHAVETPYRFFFSDLDSYHYCTAFELMGEVYGNEVAFHCAVTYGVTQNLINGFRGYTHDGPLWFRHGVSRWFTRRIDPRWMVYSVGPGEVGRTEDEADWDVKVRGRVKNDFYPGFAEVLGWFDDASLKFADHMMLWSRADWLLQERPEETGEFMRLAMAPIPWSKDRDTIVQTQFAEALAATLGDPEDIDEAWCKYVLKRYPR